MTIELIPVGLICKLLFLLFAGLGLIFVVLKDKERYQEYGVLALMFGILSLANYLCNNLSH
ncbi:MAG: hypothetical protein HY226_03710 [Candidatus Vogelbacteria bacterium]|nr:hypothetical protein [Candidatus Vogelbacteria bacterium]